MKKIIRIYNNIEEGVLIASLIFTVAVLFYQVMSRTFFNVSLSWAEELCRYIFIFQIWIGASTAERYNKHIRVEMLPSLLKSDQAKTAIYLIGNLIWFAFCIFVIFVGYKQVMELISRGTLSTGMRVPLYIIYTFVPLSSVAICIRLLPKIKNAVTMLTGRKERVEE